MKIMTKFLLTIVIGFVTISAQTQRSDIIVSESVVLNASADEVWTELRHLDKFAELFPNFVSDVWIEGYNGPKTGLERKCTAPGQKKGTVSYKETIIEFNDDKRYYAYAVEGVPAKDMVNSFKVVDLGYKRSMVIWNSAGWTFIENSQMSEEQLIGFIHSSLGEAMSALDKKFN